jgi:hypothetical protein
LQCWSRCSSSSPIIPAWRTTSFTPAIILNWRPRGSQRPARYAGIASSSAHAVHMPSHIFARLGLWQEDIQANLKSVALTQQSGAMYMGMDTNCTPCTFFFMPTCRPARMKRPGKMVEQSKQIIATAPATASDSGMLEYYGFAAAHFPALYDLEMRQLGGCGGAPAGGERIASFANESPIGRGR